MSSGVPTSLHLGSTGEGEMDSRYRSHSFVKDDDVKLGLDPSRSESYLVTYPGTRPLKYFWNFVFRIDRCKQSFGVSEAARAMSPAHETRQGQLSLLLLHFLWLVSKPYEMFGHFVEYLLNFFLANGGFLRTLARVLFDTWAVVFPKRSSEVYVSAVGVLDRRLTLYANKLLSPYELKYYQHVGDFIFSESRAGSRAAADLLVMASKLAYENAAYVERVVNRIWKMNFVEFYDCWNEFQRRRNTHVYLFTDKPENARAIIVAFRGTELFNAIDWSTNFDFSWFDIKWLGKVHVGFLEALGLGDRRRMESFVLMQQNALAQQRKEHEGSAMSGLPSQVVSDENKKLAYDDITKRVQKLMKLNPEAKLYVTGHSLGGALANLYTTLLFFNKEEEVTSRLGAVYTFGQPRLGGDEYCNFISSRLGSKYKRIVYGSDLVPRVPSDDEIFQFKHCGSCYYFDQYFAENILTEAPYPNYFSSSIKIMVTQRLMALYEVYLSCFSGRIHGPDFRENYFLTGVRLMGLLIPGIAAHMMNNYVNAVRLGKTSLTSTEKVQEFQELEAKLANIESMRSRSLFSPASSFASQEFQDFESRLITMDSTITRSLFSPASSFASQEFHESEARLMALERIRTRSLFPVSPSTTSPTFRSSITSPTFRLGDPAEKSRMRYEMEVQEMRSAEDQERKIARTAFLNDARGMLIHSTSVDDVLVSTSGIRPDVMAMGFREFEAPFEPDRVLCMFDTTDENAALVFFHTEGMATLFGVGLRFSKVILREDFVEIHELHESIWRDFWKKHTLTSYPLIFDFTGDKGRRSSESQEPEDDDVTSEHKVSQEGQHSERQPDLVSVLYNLLMEKGVNWRTIMTAYMQDRSTATTGIKEEEAGPSATTAETSSRPNSYAYLKVSKYIVESLRNGFKAFFGGFRTDSRLQLTVKNFLDSREYSFSRPEEAADSERKLDFVSNQGSVQIALEGGTLELPVYSIDAMLDLRFWYDPNAESTRRQLVAILDSTFHMEAPGSVTIGDGWFHGKLKSSFRCLDEHAVIEVPGEGEEKISSPFEYRLMTYQRGSDDSKGKEFDVSVDVASVLGFKAQKTYGEGSVKVSKADHAMVESFKDKYLEENLSINPVGAGGHEVAYEINLPTLLARASDKGPAEISGLASKGGLHTQTSKVGLKTQRKWMIAEQDEDHRFCSYELVCRRELIKHRQPEGRSPKHKKIFWPFKRRRSRKEKARRESMERHEVLVFHQKLSKRLLVNQSFSHMKSLGLW
ncbi:hypothetical protein R1flu_000347 [Riccia fluitans]|uniref:Fungal lipase-type domain-containing protein n=1 Tax=Riccia fluitans TaxID=41844 RepID=A0ABD1Y083_9MARC